MKKVLAVLAMLIIFFSGKAFQGIQEKTRNELERQAVLNHFNQGIEKAQDNGGNVFNSWFSPCDDLQDNERKVDIPPSPYGNLQDSAIPMQTGVTMTENEKAPEYKAIGRIIIDQIKVDYPILETTTNETLDISITLLYGKALNAVGNVILTGHNMKDGSLFSRLKELHEDDIIKLQDESGKTLEYKVFKSYLVDPTNLEPLDQETDGKRILTLITCTDNGKQRLIIKALNL